MKILSSLFFIATLLFGCIGNENQRKESRRPNQVYNDAKWLNSIKGNGEWVRVRRKVTDSSYLIAIYHSNGEYWLQDVFELEGPCKRLAESPVDSIEFFDGRGFILSFSNPSDDRHCYLRPTNPIESWPADLPPGIVWIGGLTQTRWVLVRASGDMDDGYQIALYENAHDARLIADSKYTMEGDCSFVKRRVIDYIIDFDGKDIILSDGNGECRLVVEN